MKRCLTCNRTYEDDALSFCLTDGSALIKDEPGSGSFDVTPSAAPPPATDWSAPPTPAVPSSQASWGPVGLPPQSPGPDWGSNYPAAPGGYAIQKKEQGLAIASLVCGIVGLFCCGLVTGIPAIVMGIMAMNKEKSDPTRYGGKGMAIGGIVLGGLSIIMTLISLIIFMSGGFDLR